MSNIRKTMRYAKPILLLLSLVLTTACIKEDLSGCKNVLLRLSYTGDSATEIFAEKIAKVDLYVFDANNSCVATHTLGSQELASRSVALRLAPGAYRAVCLGNAYEATRTEREDGCDFSLMRFLCHCTEADGRIGSADPLYFGTAAFTAPDGGQQEQTVPFSASHIDVYVEVKGYVDETSVRSSAAPVLEIDNLPAWTDFENRTSPQERLSHFPQAAVERGSYVYRYNVMRDVSGSYLHLYTASGEELYTLEIADFLAEHTEIDLTKQEALLPILIEFRNLEVVVSIPDWAVEDTEPEF